MTVIPNDGNGDVIKWLSLYLRGQSDWEAVQEISVQNLLCVIKTDLTLQPHIHTARIYNTSPIHILLPSDHSKLAVLLKPVQQNSRDTNREREGEKERERESGWVSGCVMRNADRLQHVAKCPFPHIWWETLQLKEKFLFKWHIFLSFVCLFVHKLP